MLHSETWTGSLMPFTRSIGRWAMTGLVINSIIGSGIFGVPSELIRLLGRASPLAMIVAAFAMAVIMAAVTEVASQFSEPGGPYLYVRTAFGRYAGLMVGWFWMLAVVGGGAASANLFVNYLAGILPAVGNGMWRLLTVTCLIAIPTIANCRGVRSGANLSSVLAVAKLLPLLLIIVLGLIRFALQPSGIEGAEIAAPGWNAWLGALLLLIYSYGGYEDALAPAGEVKNPRRTIPQALAAGMLICALVYTALQFVTVTTVGAAVSDRPIVDAALRLIGPGGALFVTVAVMISTYGWLSASVLNAPRLAYSFAAQRDFPAVFARLHPRFRTPVPAIFLYATLTWALAVTGSFLWALTLSAGSMMILYAGVCAALLRFRKLKPHADALRVPFGPVLAVVGIGVSLVLLSQLKTREILLMTVTALLATANWFWATRKYQKTMQRTRGV